MALEGPVVDEEADDEPGVVVDGFRRRHQAAGAEDDREVDERDPLLVGVEAVEDVDGDRGEEAEDEEEVERAVVAPGPEHAGGADDAPDDGGGEEDVVAGASPGRVRRQHVDVTDVGHVGEQPPGRAEVGRIRDQRPHQLKTEQSQHALHIELLPVRAVNESPGLVFKLTRTYS